jgi:hypothetical protein
VQIHFSQFIYSGISYVRAARPCLLEKPAHHETAFVLLDFGDSTPPARPCADCSICGLCTAAKASLGREAMASGADAAVPSGLPPEPEPGEPPGYRDAEHGVSRLPRELQGRSALTDLCAATAELASAKLDLEDAEDLISSLVAMVSSKAPGVSASAATALAVLLVPMREHGQNLGAAMREIIEDTSREAARQRGVWTSDQRARHLQLRNVELDMRCAAAARAAAQQTAKAAAGSESSSASRSSARRELQVTAYEAGGISPLVRLMGHDSPLTRCAAAHALRNVSDENQACCDAIRDAGGLSLLHGLLTSQGKVGGKEAEVGHSGGSSISAWEKRALKASLDAQQVEITEATQFWALATLGNIANSNDLNRKAIHELDIIPLLVNITTDAGAQGQAQAGGETTEAHILQQQAEARAVQADARAKQLEAVVTKLAKQAHDESCEAMRQGLPPKPKMRTTKQITKAQAEARAARVEARAAGMEARAAAVEARQKDLDDAKALGLPDDATHSTIAAERAKLSLPAERAKLGSSGRVMTPGSETLDAVSADEATGREAATTASSGKELSILAGEVLSSLLAKGDKMIEMAIVSGIVVAVQTQGAQAPVAFPELMRVLQAAARERLKKVQEGTDAASLHLALDFGRWIKLPTILLGKARNQFHATQLKKQREEEHQQRKFHMGLLPNPGLEERRQHAAAFRTQPQPPQTRSRAKTGRTARATPPRTRSATANGAIPAASSSTTTTTSNAQPTQASQTPVAKALASTRATCTSSSDASTTKRAPKSSRGGKESSRSGKVSSRGNKEATRKPRVATRYYLAAVSAPASSEAVPIAAPVPAETVPTPAPAALETATVHATNTEDEPEGTGVVERLLAWAGSAPAEDANTPADSAKDSSSGNSSGQGKAARLRDATSEIMQGFGAREDRRTKDPLVLAAQAFTSSVIDVTEDTVTPPATPLDTIAEEADDEGTGSSRGIS